MKKRVILGLLIIFTCGIFSLTAQTRSSMNKYPEEWKQVEKFEKDDLPKSANEVIGQILKKAIADKNTPQTIKALIYQNKYKIAIDNEESTQIFADLEELLNNISDVTDKALLHSMLAELYLNYFDSHAWEIRQRTAISGFVPEDIKEWSKNIFQEKALSYFSESVKPQDELLKVTTKSYEDIIVLGDDSQKIYPTIYDFLMNRAIDQSARITSDHERNSAFLKSLQVKGIQIKDLAQPTNDFVKLDFSGDENLVTLQYYKEFLQSLENRNMNEAVVLTEIKKNNYLSGRSENYRTKYAYDFLVALEKKNQQYDYNVEIIDALVGQLQNSYYSYRGGNDDEGKENQKKIYGWLKYGIDKYPNYSRVNLLKQRLSALERPTAQVTGQAVYHPDNKDKKFKLTYKNLNEATIKVLDNKTKAVVQTKKIPLSPKTTYLTEEVEFILDLNKTGDYILRADYDKKANAKSNEDRYTFNISKLANFARVSGTDEYEFYVVDRLTGEPVSGAVVTAYSTDWSNKKYTRLASVNTDEKGLAKFNSKSYFTNKNNVRYVYKVSKNTDVMLEYQDFPYSYNYNSSPIYGQDLISIFTDRSIYRPGQVVYFKAVSTLQKDINTSLINANKQYKVTLYDVNNQVVTEKTFTSNEFGSIAGEFTLPQGGLTGQYRINVGNADQYFSVEEYKRPTFQITFDKLDKSYAFGDEVRLTGHAENFSGIKVQGATVEYNIVKSSFMRWWMPSSPETVDNGSVVTKDDGSFEIVFTIPQNDTRKSWFNTIYNFDVQASVTDLNGETQSGNYNFAVGDVSMILSANIPQQLDKDSQEKIEVKATNLSGEAISAEGTYTLYSVLENDSIKAEVANGSFSTAGNMNLMAQIKKLPSAKYLLSLNAKDDKGREVVSRNYFVLYSTDDKNPPIKTNEWLIQKQTLFNSSKNAEIIFGVSADNVTILYDLIKGNQLLERQQFKLSNSNRKFIIPYKNEYEDNIVASFTYVINEVSYTKQVTLTKEEDAKNLKLKLEVFRDKLRPGQQEEWRISVKDNADKPALAELLASMYDSSLDKLRPVTTWLFNQITKGYDYPSTFNAVSFGTKSDYTYFSSPNYKVEPFRWDYLNWFGYSFNVNMYIRGYGSARMKNSVAAPAPEAKMEMMELADQSAPLEEVVQIGSNIGTLEQEAGTGGIVPEPQIRSNFKETAFFYPQMRTNEKSETIISFTVPESNTTWKFRALAYDKSLNVGTLEALAVSRKELMVTPNMPRFVRQGDKTSISTKISNLSEGPIRGKARIEFFDPLTDKVLEIKVDKYQDFTLEKDASTSATWLFEVPSGIDMVGIRIIAESESFSDGEQHVLSVLPNRMLVTESMTMNINGPQTKEFVFDKFVNNKSKTLSDYRLTLEYAGNPAWYAVQALPTLSNPTNENAVNWFASYYVNTLGASIVQQYPKVSNMIKAWKQQGGDKETLVSKIQKNEELKSVLLEETPWVLDAKDETEQMSRLSLLFDLNNTNMQTSQAIAKLKELQNGDGGWSWYKGMYSSRSMTQYILYGFTQLINLGAVQYPSDVKVMQMDALKFIDSQIRKDFENLKKNKDWEKTEYISTNQLEYLYVRSGYRDIPIDQATRAAERFYTNVAEKNWTKLNLYERSLLVAVSQKNGNKEIASKIMNSIREHATGNEEMGMFWANNTSHVFMSQSAVAVHTFLMQAFKETNAPQSEMDQLKQWLLKQKQTQVWESTHATIDAIYALLSTGSDWLASSGDSKITIGKQTVEPQNKELGTGYIKEAWTTSQISKDMGKVQIQKPDNGPAWGALYWQYYKDLDKITSQKGELSVDKKLFVEKSTAQGKSLVEVTESNLLKVGDKVTVRLTVRADRDMEFVQLKDMRASCFEPVETISGLRWQNASYYYQSTKDASTNFYFDNLRKGAYVFEYSVYVNRVGEYSNGITSIQCMYAPEFVSHTSRIKVEVR